MDAKVEIFLLVKVEGRGEGGSGLQKTKVILWYCINIKRKVSRSS